MAVRVGLYARVSTSDQDVGAQLARLRTWAAPEGLTVALERTDTATGKNVRRPGLEEILNEARGRHIQLVAVVKMDRLTRSVLHLSGVLHELRDLGSGFVAIDQGIRISRDRPDPTSDLVLNALAAVAEWEGSIISERTRESPAVLKARGVRLGRPPKKGIPAALSEPTPAKEGPGNDRFWRRAKTLRGPPKPRYRGGRLTIENGARSQTSDMV